MSEEETSTGDECALRIDTERSAIERGKAVRGKGKGRAKRKGGAKRNGLQQELGASPKPGDVVWAKVTGFNFWPAKVRAWCLTGHY